MCGQTFIVAVFQSRWLFASFAGKWTMKTPVLCFMKCQPQEPRHHFSPNHYSSPNWTYGDSTLWHLKGHRSMFCFSTENDDYWPATGCVWVVNNTKCRIISSPSQQPAAQWKQWWTMTNCHCKQNPSLLWLTNHQPSFLISHKPLLQRTPPVVN